MWKTITTGWDFFRLIRLGLGVAALVQAILLGEWVLAVAGALIAGLALANMGCGINGCSTPRHYRTPATTNTENISYEEVDTK